MEVTTQVTHELLKVRGRKALLEKEIEVLAEQETFLSGIVDSTVAESTTKRKTKSAANVDTDTEDDTGTVATSTPAKRGKKSAPVELEASTDADEEEVSELDEALGEDEAEVSGATEDDVRKLLTTIVKKRGEAGKKKAREVLMKFTTNKSGLVKDIKNGKFQDVYESLSKIG